MFIVFLILSRENKEAKRSQKISNDYKNLIDNINQENHAHLIKMDNQGNTKHDSSKELQETKAKLAELERKIAILEGRIPEKYPNVKFLGFKERKRILVSTNS